MPKHMVSSSAPPPRTGLRAVGEVVLCTDGPARLDSVEKMEVDLEVPRREASMDQT